MATLPGLRIRENDAFGTIIDNPLSAGATTFNSPGLANLRTITSDHAIVVLDPLRQTGAPEIIMVTSHASAATVATIQRGMYGTTPRSHARNTMWTNAATNDDFIRTLTSSTRPADVFEGQLIYEADTDSYKAHNGSGWEQVLTLGAWASYTGTNPPTSTSGTLTTVSGTGAYSKVGRTVFYRYSVTITTVGTGTGDIRFDLPVAASANHKAFGSGRENGVSGEVLVVYPFSSTRVTIRTNSALANGKIYDVTGIYEAAS